MVRPGLNSVGRAGLNAIRKVCRKALNEPAGSQNAIPPTPMQAPSDRSGLLGRSGTATLFLPPKLVQTAKKSKSRTSPPNSESPDAATNFQEVESEILARLSGDASTSSAAVLAVDPDNSGAIAIVHLNLGNEPTCEMIKRSDVSIYDMPVETVPTAKRMRRQADPCEVSSIVSSLRDNLPEGASIYAVVEKPIPGPLNGTFSVFGTGYSFGVWAGVLSSNKIELNTVSARRWKSDLGLNGLGKEGSRSMALELFPQAAHLLSRKKDHGRAEALLLSAWALGIRVPSVVQLEYSGTDEDDSQMENNVVPTVSPSNASRALIQTLDKRKLKVCIT